MIILRIIEVFISFEGTFTEIPLELHFEHFGLRGLIELLFTHNELIYN